MGRSRLLALPNDLIGISAQTFPCVFTLLFSRLPYLVIFGVIFYGVMTFAVMNYGSMISGVINCRAIKQGSMTCANSSVLSLPGGSCLPSFSLLCRRV